MGWVGWGRSRRSSLQPGGLGAGASLPHMPLGKVVGCITGPAWLTVACPPFLTPSRWCDQAQQNCVRPESAVLWRRGCLVSLSHCGSPGGGSVGPLAQGSTLCSAPPALPPSSLPGALPSFLSSLGTWAKSRRLSVLSAPVCETRSDQSLPAFLRQRGRSSPASRGARTSFGGWKPGLSFSM